MKKVYGVERKQKFSESAVFKRETISELHQEQKAHKSKYTTSIQTIEDGKVKTYYRGFDTKEAADRWIDSMQKKKTIFMASTKESPR